MLYYRKTLIGFKLFIVVVLLAIASCKGNQTGSQPVARWVAGPDIGKLDLLAVDFIDAEKGWAVGDIEPSGATSGAIFHTTDGGASWQPISRTSEVFAAVHFVSPARGWIAGYAGRIERTDDGGKNWLKQRIEREGEVLNSIFFIDEQRGWVVGGSGLVFKTTNGGDSWEVSRTGRIEDLWAVRFASAERGWIVGEDGLILATTDGGATWTVQTSGTGRALHSLAVVAPSLAVAAGQGGTIMRSEDGTTWNEVASNTTETLNAVAAASKEIFWAVGYNGATGGSTDGGATWAAANPVSSRNLMAIDLVDSAHGVAAGRRGVMQKLQK